MFKSKLNDNDYMYLRDQVLTLQTQLNRIERCFYRLLKSCKDSVDSVTYSIEHSKPTDEDTMFSNSISSNSISSNSISLNSIPSQDSKADFISELKQIFHDGIKSKRISGSRTIPLTPEELEIAKSIPENDRLVLMIQSDVKDLDLIWRINSFNELEFVGRIAYEDGRKEEKTYIKNTLLRDFPNEEERAYTQDYSLDS